ncbi:amidase [uncultured Roseobacter sp.]|uniref:amidase n=1 Tax=uncultured Roseobacter sp. TaxID=114847 RepID=UPI00261543C5|nr:amidase [uncultured Roseobacter sp.]
MIDRPEASDVRAAGAELGLALSAEDSASFLGLMGGLFEAYDLVDEMESPLPPATYDRSPGVRPDPADNPFNAWVVKTEIKGAPGGKLSGKTVAIKDNVNVAGVTMENGSTILEGYVPETDATIVTRLLEAGADIHGKAVCEYYCASGGSHTSASGLVENPVVPGHNAGGSSSGSAVLVAAGIVDMATGGDQGGSIRIPASFCGVVGLKPTHGLVPYTGIFPVELTVDHAGPITRTVADNALMLEVMAGPDGLDPRQTGAPSQAYPEGIGVPTRGLKVGVVAQGFGHPGGEAEVDARIHEVAERLGTQGAEVEEVSMPLHAAGAAIWTPIFLEGATELMMRQNAYGTNMKGVFLESLLEKQSQWKARSNEMSETLKLGLLMGHYMSSRHKGRYYGKAQNLNRLLTAAYDDLLAKCDVLLMPTTPMATHPLPGPDAPRETIVERAFAMIPNTAPSCATGHPSISVPAGTTDDGRPIGAMFIGRKLEEKTLYRAAAAVEQLSFQKMTAE